jgi:hypothetical protein
MNTKNVLQVLRPKKQIINDGMALMVVLQYLGHQILQVE